MKYNFDEVIDRKGTHAMKVERLPKGADKDSLALWVADMDFACAEPILKALHERIDRKIFGYTVRCGRVHGCCDRLDEEALRLG